jgi:hypothetical protein
MEGGKAMYKEDGSDDPEFQNWKQLQKVSWMLAIPSGKAGYDLYQGGEQELREEALRKARRDEEQRKEAGKAKSKTVYATLFDDLDDQ